MKYIIELKTHWEHIRFNYYLQIYLCSGKNFNEEAQKQIVHKDVDASIKKCNEGRIIRKEIIAGEEMPSQGRGK